MYFFALFLSFFIWFCHVLFKLSLILVIAVLLDVVIEFVVDLCINVVVDVVIDVNFDVVSEFHLRYWCCCCCFVSDVFLDVAICVAIDVVHVYVWSRRGPVEFVC